MSFCCQDDWDFKGPYDNRTIEEKNISRYRIKQKNIKKGEICKFCEFYQKETIPPQKWSVCLASPNWPGTKRKKHTKDEDSCRDFSKKEINIVGAREGQDRE